MADLPEEIKRSLVRGVAAYVRATPATELPTSLGPIKKTAQTAKGLSRHSAQLLKVLDDDALRARIAEWLEDGKPALSKEEVASLRLATERPEGWEDQLGQAASAKAAVKTKDPGPDVAELERRLEKERDALKRAKEEAKRAKEAEREAIRVERGRSLRLDEEREGLRRTLDEREQDLTFVTARLDRTEKELERVKRKAKTDLDKLRDQVKQLRDENRDLKKRIIDAERAQRAKDAADRPKPKSKGTAAASAPAGPRAVLSVPKGRLEDAPETLQAWLDAPRVTLLVDGYNVSRCESGFPHLTLEQQRDRLRDLLKKLSNRLKVATVLVWDGAEVGPGTRRLAAGFLTEEYSEPDRSGKGTDKDRADRHIIKLLTQMPPTPVVLVTNDRALQDDARSHRATIATSDQLLAVLH